MSGQSLCITTERLEKELGDGGTGMEVGICWGFGGVE